MTSRELETLNIIYRLGGQCSTQMVSKETGLSSDYTFLISQELLNQKLIKKTANNIFILTASGRSLLGRSRDALEGKKKTPTLIEVSRSFGSGVKPASFEPEISFINPEAIPSGCYGAGKGFAVGESALVEHNLSKSQVAEKADAQSIQKSIKRLIFAGRKLIKD